MGYILVPAQFPKPRHNPVPPSAQNNPASQFLSPDRIFPWNPGRMSKGGIINRSTIFTTLSPSGGDDTTTIQTALNNCPAGQVVKLSAGTFLINQTQSPLIITTGITLRGSGAGQTIIKKNIQTPLPRTASNVGGTTIKQPPTQGTMDNAPIIIIGPGRFCGVDNGDINSYAPTSSQNLTTDGLYGAYTIQVADASVFTVGRFVLIDEVSGATLQATPPGFLNNNTNGTAGTVQVMQGDRVVWNQHTPTQTFQDDPVDAYGWFSRPDPVNVATGSYTDGRVTCEIKEIASISGNTITFTSPLTLTYRTSHSAQCTRYTSTPATGNSVHIQDAGVEDLTVYLSGGGGIFFGCAAYCWAKRIEVDTCFGLGVMFANCFRCEITDSYIHTSAQPTPAADSYAVCMQNGSSEILIENNIMRDYCKPVAARASGAGSVIGYCYIDDCWDWYDSGNAATDAQYAQWQESGVNASHMGGSHHVLFEGNYAHNCESDYTHGNSIYMFAFRNHLSGFRKNFTNETNAHCGGGAMYSWWFSYVGNVMGIRGAMAGWAYTDTRMGCDVNGDNCVGAPSSGWTTGTGWDNNCIWHFSYDPERWPCNPDTKSLATLVRDGNFDHLTGTQKWHTTPHGYTIPDSMYLKSPPAFFGTNRWPWVDANTGNTYTLPAKYRYENGTPNSP